MPQVIIAMGANLNGRWGLPDHTIRRAVKLLNNAGLKQINCSPFYHTLPLGTGTQPNYYNIVLTAVTRMLPSALLHLLQKIERQAGRRLGSHWGARVLDIDIIDYNGWIMGWPPPELSQAGINRGRRARGGLILPHPQAHLRSFVLYPLREVAPFWRHHALDMSVSQMIARLPVKRGVERLNLPLDIPMGLASAVEI